ncbi:Las1-domain-containing protein [Ramicandelaber brevisporus]|nr:Las1-domain-containing protein [Ramicandelaber brevisporus]
MLIRVPRVVPWTSHEEFEQVYRWLYSDLVEEPQLCQLGVKRVKAWSARGRVPQSVDSTAFGSMNQRSQQQQQQQLSIDERRHMFSMAFIRFFNGFVDNEQRGKFADNTSKLAERLGMPAWFVDVRHEGTHGKMPSLTILRAAAAQALNWLRNSYWELQNGISSSTSNNTDMNEDEESSPADVDARDALRSMLLNYKQAATNLLNIDMELKRVRYDLISFSVEEPSKAAISILLENGMLVPESKKKRANMADVSLPESSSEVWSVLLNRFEQVAPSFTSDFLQEIAQVIGGNEQEELTAELKALSTSKSYCATLTAWACELAKLSMETDSVKLILGAYLRRPNKLTSHVVEAIAKSNPSLKPTIAPFVAFMRQSVDVDTDTVVDNVSALKEALTRNEAHARARQSETQLYVSSTLNSNSGEMMDIDTEADIQSTAIKGWTKVKAAHWQVTPLGCLPGGQVPNLELPLEWDL